MESIVEAENNLSALIDRALAGEDIVFTRHGTPVVMLGPVVAQPRRMTKADLEWLDRHRVDLSPRMDSVTLIRSMRDEGY